MSNQIGVIAPYWLEAAGTWVFDDESVGLRQEPFVSGVPEMIGDLVRDIPNARAKMLESWQARLLRLKLSNQTLVAPSAEEIEVLTMRVSDPLISRVASRLVAESAANGEAAAVARIALRELHAACQHRSLES